jgi:hypothetical protein
LAANANTAGMTIAARAALFRAATFSTAADPFAPPAKAVAIARRMLLAAPVTSAVSWLSRVLIWRSVRRLRLEERVDVVGEQLGVLVQKSVAGVRIDPQLGVGEAFSEQVAVLGVHHRVIVAVGDKRWLGNAGKPLEL